MAKKTRAELTDLITANILSGGRRTTASKVREAVSALVESLPNILDDADEVKGYVSIDASGRSVVTSFNVASPTGQLLSDSGTFVDRKYSPIFKSYADSGNTGSGETDLVSNTISAYQLRANGDILDAQYAGSFRASATETRQLKIYFAGTMIFDGTALSMASGGDWILSVKVIRVSSTVIRYSVNYSIENNPLSHLLTVGELTGLTLSSTNILKITGQSAGASPATNDIVLKLSSVDYYKAP